MNVRLADTLLEATHVDFASECRDEVGKQSMPACKGIVATGPVLTHHDVGISGPATLIC